MNSSWSSGTAFTLNAATAAAASGSVFQRVESTMPNGDSPLAAITKWFLSVTMAPRFCSARRKPRVPLDRPRESA